MTLLPEATLLESLLNDWSLKVDLDKFWEPYRPNCCDLLVVAPKKLCDIYNYNMRPNKILNLSSRQFSSTKGFFVDGKFDMDAFQRRFERTLVPAHQAFDRK
jgi:hypothetical protein